MKARMRGQMLVAGEESVDDLDIAGIEILQHQHASGDIRLDMEAADAAGR